MNVSRLLIPAALALSLCLVTPGQSQAQRGGRGGNGGGSYHSGGGNYHGGGGSYHGGYNHGGYNHGGSGFGYGLAAGVLLGSSRLGSGYGYGIGNRGYYGSGYGIGIGTRAYYGSSYGSGYGYGYSGYSSPYYYGTTTPLAVTAVPSYYSSPDVSGYYTPGVTGYSTPDVPGYGTPEVPGVASDLSTSPPASPPASPSASPSTNQSGYFAPTEPTTADIEVRVPADAEVWFDGNKTSMTGPNRVFASPQLDPSKSYRYEIRARWMQEGKPVDLVRTVEVRAGQRSLADFMAQ